jgi:hypothetical protein
LLTYRVAAGPIAQTTAWSQWLRARCDWAVIVPLNGAGRETIPESLSVTREWLDYCGFHATSVTLDGETHLLLGNRQRVRAAVQFAEG